ncbi:hypothetical protein [Flavivirga eckloniae]|uniref:Uncharacterized protein n=1 Tax=Flavivirga eckloniae TaxID=1803846 RepID=A0A2K9PW71_9FLAO|nr:hypothetical protein [Flavivirga eckloniae]AUP81322.1 hypothetical protein C1H87_22415 [Flavivirga eckloniae]
MKNILAYHVTVLSNIGLNFPKFCPVCGKKNNQFDVFTIVKSRGSSEFEGKTIITQILEDSLVGVVVPVCSNTCKEKQENQMNYRNIIYWGSGIVGIITTVTLDQLLDLNLNKLSFICICSLFILPIVVYEVVMSHAYLEVYDKGLNIEFSFKNKTYAKEFAKLNNTSVT